MDSPSFNLVDEAWIPVVEGGRPRVLSLIDVLSRAHEIDGLATANPLEAVAVFRQVLLPVYLDACGIPDSEGGWKQRWRDGHLPAERIKEYLGDQRARFDLFGGRPFGQVAGLRTAKDEDKPVSLLIAATATGNNVPLFTPRTEANPPALTPAEAARAMLATQCWDTAAIKSGAADDPQAKGGKTTGNPTGPCGALGVTVPIGRNLAETVLLNSPIVRQPPPGDVPQWRRDRAMTGAWEVRGPMGLLDLLTWQSRRVRLIPDRDAAGGVVVRRVLLTAGDRMQPLPQDVEPHTAWRRVDKPRAGQAPVAPVRHAVGRDAWRGLGPMMATVPQEGAAFNSSILLAQLADLGVDDVPLQVLTVGVAYGNQSAVVEDVIADLIPLPLAALAPGEVRGLIETVVVQAEDLRRAGNRLDDDLRRASGGDPVPWDKGLRPGDALMQDLNRVVRRLLAGLQREPGRYDDAEDAWRTAAQTLALKVAEPALAAAPPTAFLGREDDKQKKAYRASLAEVWFRASVRKILGIES
ncbi:type I-E CRISPR-associated protein Cse1/CasA [Micromonospora sp. 4G55]|uniref:type I-E CRISPR-associated protein Cse1/CasA n=1 Tax=Micromonospora sp. 4G55 TaxID=2806102 RepID=UPI001A624356|nr:type I-E CRISPR-associated protein Cse1/CasA [Micromonospora sp. 4G55]MBM0258164.1 type I-E CRISPR-associated protein Cse1/CasA [Micromonospora sp. 4G55]